MNRRLWLLNLLLLALIAGGVWQIRRSWLDSQARKQVVLNQAIKPPAAPPVLIPAPPQPVTGAQYLEVASELLTARDRTPNVTIDVETPKPPPPFPRFFGAMDFGEGLRVVMSVKAGAPQKSYKLGDNIGEFKILNVTRAGIDFDWGGKRLFAKMSELRDTTPIQEAAPPPQTTAAAPPPTAGPVVISGPAATRPGSELTPELKACQPGDTSPPGAIVDGHRKVVSQTPFGSACRWEKVK